MVYDVIVLGTGPAGLSAAVYCKRYDLNILSIGKESGMMSEADEICNYLGFPHISGFQMAKSFLDHAKELGVEVKSEEVKGLKKEETKFVVETDNGTYEAITVIYALGGVKRRLGLPEEKNFVGKGVSYCFTCDAPFFKDKVVAVTGGANSAVMGALLLSKFAKKVFIIYRRDKLRAFPAFIKKIKKTENIETVFSSIVKKIEGDNLVEKVFLENSKTGEKSELELNGIFVEYGCIPNSSLAKEAGVETDERGRIMVKGGMSTNVKGFFAAGDVTTGSNGFDQVITAAAEGAIAASSVYKLISEVG